MKKLKIYLDTSVISHLDQQDAPEKMVETANFWELLKQGKYDVYISDVVTEELGSCSEPKLSLLAAKVRELEYTHIESTTDVLELAEKFVDFGVLKQKSIDDCTHIALAIIAGCDIIVSWNFKHIVNPKTIKGVRVITTAEGYKDLIICSPTMMTEGELYD